MSDRLYIRRCYKCSEEVKTKQLGGRLVCSLCKGTVNYPRVFYKNKKIVLKRDENKCQCCGDKNKIHIHHIDCNKKNNSTSNLITLCNQCHISLHRRFTDKELRQGNIYKMFPKNFRWGSFGKRADYKDPKKEVKKVNKIIKTFHKSNIKSVLLDQIN